MDKQDDFQYSGIDNLEVMSEAINYNRFLEELIKRHASAAERIVDFGAGIGTFALPLHHLHKNVVAIEPDPEQRRRLTALAILSYPSIEALEDNWADLIYSINVLEHIEDDEGALRRIYSKLSPRGRVLVYVPAFQILFSSMDRKVHHFRRYRKKALVEKMQRQGFEVVDARYADSLGFLATFLFKHFGNDKGDINRTALVLFDRLLFPLSRILDFFVSAWFGKNLIIVATKYANHPHSPNQD